MTEQELAELGGKALGCLLEQKPVTITRHKDEPRNGMPLPIKRMEPDAAGNVTQQYRPLAIFEYINDVLSGELASRQAKKRKKETV